MHHVLRVACSLQPSPLTRKTLEILRRTLKERADVDLLAEGDRSPQLILDLSSGIGAEGFRIEDADGAVRIVGNDERGLLYGVGKFLHTSRFGEGEFQPSSWRGTFVPEKPVRGIYFATHFHNFFHDAPLAEVERYVEELALWGCNALNVWFDMHHYTGIDDPAAQQMIQRLRAILQAANRVGIGGSLGVLANEAYANSPEELRSVPASFTGCYFVELCPSKPGGLELILKWRREMLEAFAGLDLEYFWIWPYDQGGCLCEQCEPWGGNGFLKAAEPVARLVGEYFPKAKIVLSTWCFGYQYPEEWATFAKAFAQKPDWVDYLMVDSHNDFPEFVRQHGPPGGLPVVNFPEISMWGMGPWGGWGANPLPQRFQRLWDQCREMVSGGFPYCEGIYEDLNKAVLLQFYWDSNRPAEDTVREYIACEFSPEVVEKISEVMRILEANHGHHLMKRDAESEPLRCNLPSMNREQAQRAFELVQQVETHLASHARRSWRWRILWLRAALDAELASTDGVINEKCGEWFRELAMIYHGAQAERHVAPPTTLANC